MWGQVCGDPEEVSNPIAEFANSTCLFSRPLIVGASVSNGFNTTSHMGPSEVIARRINPATAIINISQDHTASLHSLKNHTMPVDPSPSIVMGLDLFFWDAVNGNCGPEFIANTVHFIRMYKDKNIPLILGRLPLEVDQPSSYRLLKQNDCANRINSLLEFECKENCMIFNPKPCLDHIKKLVEDKVKEICSKNPSLSTATEYKNQFKLYFSDGKHPTDLGNKICADDFMADAAYKQLKCSN